jgi:NitT/TauT family transport system substrate-binding protein
VAIPEEPGPELAPVLVADALGEFEVEGLTVELVPLDDRAAMAALDAGTADVAVGRLGGAYLDAVEDGGGARLVLGGVVAANPNNLGLPQTGLWVRDDALASEEDPGDLGNLELQRVGMPDGVRSAAAYPAELAFSQTDITLNEVALTDSLDGDPAAELRDGNLAAAWLDGADWAEVADQAGIRLAATLPASESIDGTVVSARLLGPDRPVGVAYARAIIRTINTHLTGDYREDDEVVAAIAEGTGLPAEAVRDDLPAELFDWELRAGTLGRLEESLLRLGGVGYDAPTDPATHLDRTLAADAVGASAS